MWCIIVTFKQESYHRIVNEPALKIWLGKAVKGIKIRLGKAEIRIKIRSRAKDKFIPLLRKFFLFFFRFFLTPLIIFHFSIYIYIYIYIPVQYILASF